MGLTDAFATDLDSVVKWVRETLCSTMGADDARRGAMRERIALYRGGRSAMPYYEKMLEELFANMKVRARRMAVLRHARMQNGLRRIVEDIAKVYHIAPTRILASDGAWSTFREVARAIDLDRRMGYCNRMVELCNEVLLWVHPSPTEPVEPRLRVVTPDCFRAIAHPRDLNSLLGVIIDTTPTGPGVKDTDVWFELWDDTQRVGLSRHYTIVPGSVQPHPLGRLPGILVHREVWDGLLLEPESGQDMVDGQYTATLHNCLLVKNAKSGTRLPYATGDTSQVTRGQAMDEEELVELREGIQVGVLDLLTDPSHLLASLRASIAQPAANRGIPEDALMGGSAAAQQAQGLVRAALKERRLAQLELYRRVEGELVTLLAAWCGVFSPAMAFDPDGYRVNFAEVPENLSPMERELVDEKRIEKGYTTRAKVLVERDPDLSEVEAQEIVEANLSQTVADIQILKATNTRIDGTSADPGASAADNGATGGRPRRAADEQMDAERTAAMAEA